MFNNLFGLIGFPLGHSYSPMIHRAIFKYTEIKGDYMLHQINSREIRHFLKTLKIRGISGINVTIPYKQLVIPYMDKISCEALKIGAVNTIKPDSTGLSGYNTDYKGFTDTLERDSIKVAGGNVLILGDGGSARTVYTCMSDLHVSTIYMATRKKADEVQNIFDKAKIITYEDVYDLNSLKLTVNCTPVGMYPNNEESPLNESRIPPMDALVDLIYNPAKTRLMKTVEKKCGRVVNGLYMLVSQAVAAQEIWMDKKIDTEITSKVYEEVKMMCTF